MLVLHSVILSVLLIMMTAGIFYPLPKELLSESAYLKPFLKSAVFILDIRKRIRNGKIKNRNYSADALSVNPEIKKQLQLLNPAKGGDSLLYNYDIKQLGNSLMLVFAGNLAAMLLCVQAMDNNTLVRGQFIGRNTYGGGAKTVNLDIYSDDELIAKNKKITVSERQYTKEETAEKFSEMMEIIKKNILGKNKSFDRVCYDLNLMESIEGYPVSISWSLTNYNVMDSYGKINRDKLDEKGTIVGLTATLSYEDYVEKQQFNVMVFPAPEDRQKTLIEEIEENIAAYEKKTLSRDESVLPPKVNGKKIVYKNSESSDSLILFALIMILAVILFKSGESTLEKEMKKRENQMMMDYPQIVSKLTLLIGAGMTIQMAFKKLAADYEKRKRSEKEGYYRYAYEEVLLTVRQIKSGMSEGNAYVKFGNRCRLQKYVKLGALLSQNLKRGAKGLLDTLSEEEKEAFEERKSLARKLGEEAGTKLLLPMGMMLMIVLVIVVLPAFLNFSL